jgi:hypothetical protein
MDGKRLIKILVLKDVGNHIVCARFHSFEGHGKCNKSIFIRAFKWWTVTIFTLLNTSHIEESLISKARLEFKFKLSIKAHLFGKFGLHGLRYNIILDLIDLLIHSFVEEVDLTVEGQFAAHIVLRVTVTFAIKVEFKFGVFVLEGLAHLLLN